MEERKEGEGEEGPGWGGEGRGGEGRESLHYLLASWEASAGREKASKNSLSLRRRARIFFRIRVHLPCTTAQGSMFLRNISGPGCRESKGIRGPFWRD